MVVVAPELVTVYGDLGRARLSPWPIVGMVIVTAAGWAANWHLHRIVLRTQGWFDVASSQLVGNAASHVLPSGSAVGAGVQLRLLAAAGFPVPETATALGVITVLNTVMGFVVLPLVAIAASAFGAAVDPAILHTLWIGAAVAAMILGAAVSALVSESFWGRVAGVLARVHARLRREADARALRDRLLQERVSIRDALRGRRTGIAVLALARPVSDFAVLWLALVATGVRLEPVVALGAFLVSNLAGLIPFTPGGLGFVEGSLTGVLSLGGVAAQRADVAVATYRIAGSWLPSLIGAGALALFRRRHRRDET